MPVLIQYASLTGYLHCLGFVNLYGGPILPVIMTPQISGALMMLAFLVLLLFWYRDFISQKEFRIRKLSGAAVCGVLALYLVAQLLSPQVISVKINGKNVCFVGVAPYKQEETVMVPIKGFLNSAGYFITVSQDTGNIVALKDGKTAEFDFSAEEVIINGERTKLLYPHTNLNSNNYLSSADLSQICNMTETYENGTLHFVNQS